MSESSDGKSSHPGGRVVAVWAVTVALFAFGVGGFVTIAVEGVQMSQIPKTPALLALASLLVSIGLTVAWARGLGAAGEAGPSPGRAAPSIGRRRFLTGGAAITGGVLASAGALLARIYPWLTVTVNPIVNVDVEKTSPTPQRDWQGARVRSYRRLGRTGFQVSDISLGSGQIANSENGEAIARAAIERGVNYFDTAPDYSEYGSEMVLGRAIKGQRDRMFLATKFCTASGHLNAGASVADYMAVVESSLGRLQTDYVDLVHIHSCNTVDRLMDPNAHEAFDRLKEQGKARFLGVSTHTPNLVEVASTAIESDRFDVMMLAYHHGSWPQLADLIDRSAATDIGIVAMKTLKGAKHKGMAQFRGKTDAYSQAAFKWVLSNPSVSCLVVSFFELQHVDEYLHASGRALASADVALLEDYDRAIAGTHCLPHCGVCLGSCPEELAIHDVLRHRMYFEDYGREKYAMELYSKLEKQADVCVGCSAPCTGSCPVGIPIQQHTIEAHGMLTLA